MSQAYGTFAKGNNDGNAHLLTVFQSVADGEVGTIVYEPFWIVILQQSFESAFIPTGLFRASFLEVNVGDQWIRAGENKLWAARWTLDRERCVSANGYRLFCSLLESRPLLPSNGSIQCRSSP